MCSHIGTRETVHYETAYRASTEALLRGVRHENPILKGTYRVDIHHANDNGITFKYLDGRTVTIYGKGSRAVFGNWRKDEGYTGEIAAYYELPFDILVPGRVKNLIPVGRMMNADDGAFGALRVMVNLNQLGEAAGVAAYLAVDGGLPTAEISREKLNRLLREGGSAL